LVGFGLRNADNVRISGENHDLGLISVSGRAKPL
jgi:hypothetical protein